MKIKISKKLTTSITIILALIGLVIMICGHPELSAIPFLLAVLLSAAK